MRAYSSLVRVTACVLLLLGAAEVLSAGMPALLPSEWTADRADLYDSPPSNSPTVAWQTQALSFFITCLFAGAFAVQRLWNYSRRDFPILPQISYRRALSLVVMWGLLFVVVLTMISGARELMTPGAWRKQGWTYQLTRATPTTGTESDGGRDDRRKGLEQLRTSLWIYAAAHGGKFPPRETAHVDARLWQVPGNPGLQFFMIADRSAEETGRLLVFEPQIEGDDRLVLLTNGMIGTMRTDEIRLAIERRDQPVANRSEEDVP
jgi:hypothetical protein